MPGTYLHGEVVVLEGVSDALRHRHRVLADAGFPGHDTQRRAGGNGGLSAGASRNARGRVALTRTERGRSNGGRHCAMWDSTTCVRRGMPAYGSAASTCSPKSEAFYPIATHPRRHPRVSGLERPFFLPRGNLSKLRVERRGALFSRAGSSTRINRERRVSTRFRSSSTGELPTDAARASEHL